MNPLEQIKKATIIRERIRDSLALLDRESREIAWALLEIWYKSNHLALKKTEKSYFDKKAIKKYLKEVKGKDIKWAILIVRRWNTEEVKKIEELYIKLLDFIEVLHEKLTEGLEYIGKNMVLNWIYNLSKKIDKWEITYEDFEYTKNQIAETENIFNGIIEEIRKICNLENLREICDWLGLKAL